jgi:hypothetical protein
VRRSIWATTLMAFMISGSLVAVAQVGGKPISGGNPTPGTAQPDPPNLADRITLTGCLQPAPEGNAGARVDANTPMDTRYVLTGAQRVNRLPPDTGGSDLATKTSSGTFRLEGIESQFSPFLNTKVEISGEVKLSSGSSAPPTLVVEFVQRLEPRC